MKYNFLKYLVFSIIIYQFINNQSKAQDSLFTINKIYNYYDLSSEIFRHASIIFDAFLINNPKLFLTNDELISQNDNGKLIRYGLNKHFFNKLAFSNNIIYLINKFNNIVNKVENGINYTFNNSSVASLNLETYTIDNYNSLWLIYYNFVLKKTKIINWRNMNIREFNCKYDIYDYEAKLIIPFNHKILCFGIDLFKKPVLIEITDTTEKFIELLSDDEFESSYYNYFINNNKIYIIGINGDLFIIDENLNSISQKINKIKFHCFNFIVTDENLLVPYEKGIMEYNLTDHKKRYLKLENDLNLNYSVRLQYDKVNHKLFILFGNNIRTSECDRISKILYFYY